jgi:hypothetical protein
VPRYSFWEEILLGELHQPHNESVDEKMEQVLFHGVFIEMMHGLFGAKNVNKILNKGIFTWE